MNRTLALVLLVAFILIVGGCSSYHTPGSGADLASLSPDARAALKSARAQQTDSSIDAKLDKKPLAALPTPIAIARVQAAGYRSQTATGWGSGKLTLITVRDVESDAAIERLTHLPMTRGIAPLSRLLVQPPLNSDQPLREAAASLHADMLLIYTFETNFYVNDLATPLTVISFGLSPNQKAVVETTASAILIDTRNGYVYATAEATDRQTEPASAWTSDDAIDRTRLRTEKAAFEKLVGEFEKSWAGVVREYGPATAAK